MLKRTAGSWVLFIVLQVVLPATVFAVETAPRISDREITEKLARLEAGQEALRSEMKSGYEALSVRISDLREDMKSGQESLRAEMKSDQLALRSEMKSGYESLRAEMKSGQEALGKRLDDLSGRQADANATMLVLFSSLIALIVALFGYMIWDRRTMMKPVAEKLHRFEYAVITDLDMNHVDGSLLRRQLEALRQYAGKNPEFAEIMRSLSLL
ncbi:MAG: hypothetical protein ABR534_15925 [Desulfotignum sp.]